jgi:hypothetical protein
LSLSLALALAFPGGPSHEEAPARAERCLVRIAGDQGNLVDSGAALAISSDILEEIGVPGFASFSGASGAGQVIAVVDTGIDPLTPGFLDPRGINRIRDWQDFTGEGAATLIGRFSCSSGFVDVGAIRLDVSGLRTLSGTCLVGTLPDAIRQAGGWQDPVYFALTDPDEEGRFDSAAIDVDRDLALGDDPVLRAFGESGRVAAIPVSEDETISVVLAKVERNGETVVFGADLNGHGTALAAIAAGSGPGSYAGVSPKSDILAVKVVRTDGLGDWFNVETGIRYALERGADVILVGAVPDRVPDDQAWARLQQAVAAQGSHLIIPVGNKGPGVGTVSFTRCADSTVVVGGSFPDAVASRQIEGAIGVLGWYPLSSCGPDPKGNRGVDLLAPAVTVAPKNGYHSQARFEVLQGTSASAAYVAGAVSLLREAGGVHEGRDNSSRVLKALIEGAEPLPGLLLVEQGLGRLSMGGAWSRFKEGISISRLQIARKWDGVVSTDGVWLRGTNVGAMPLWVDNLDPLARRVALTASATWLRPQADYVLMPAVSQRLTWVQGSEELPPGFYSAELKADDPATPGVESRLSVSLAIPYRLSSAGEVPGSGKIRLDLSGSPVRGVAREFFEVPVVAEAMSLRFEGGAGAIYALYSPEGILVDIGRISRDSVIRVGLPAAGLWQVAVLRDPHYAGGAVLPTYAEVSFATPFVLNLGTTAEWTELVVASAAPHSTILLAAGRDASHEWRYRHSLDISRDSAVTITYPAVTEDVEAISLRIGTVTGSQVKAYLYHFSQKEGKWTEVAATGTGTSSTGAVYYPNPEAGLYVAYVEGYGSRPIVYAEIDTLVLGKSPGSSDLQAKAGEAEFLDGMVRERYSVQPRAGSGSSRYVVIRPRSGAGVLGVFERPAVNNSDVPVIQVSGERALGPQLRTIRAWAPSGRYPIDIVVTVGTKSYQLDNGKATAWVDERVLVSCESQDGNGVLVFPEAWGDR